MLGLIKAFRKITDQDARRLVLLHVEELLEQQQARSRQNPPSASH
jgi:hypothetical protein